MEKFNGIHNISFSAYVDVDYGNYMIYRDFCLSDLNHVEVISRDSFPIPLSKIAIILLSVVARVYVAVDGRHIAGYIVLGERNNSELFVFHLAVKKEYQRGGVASGFIKRYVDRTCYVRTHISNCVSQEFYKKHGFMVLKRERYSGDEDEYLMVRKL